MVKFICYLCKIIQKVNFYFGYLYYKYSYRKIDKTGKIHNISNLIKKQFGDKDYYLSPVFSTLAYNNSYRIPLFLPNLKTKSIIKNAKYNAGEKIKFYTNSKDLVLEILYEKKAILNNMNEKAACGIVIIVSFEGKSNKYILFSNKKNNMRITKKINLENEEKRTLVTIYLPSYACINRIIFGFQKESYIEKYQYNKKPIIFYGSSITQGCASEDVSLNYVNIIGDYYDIPILNYGFSESAKGEESVIQYIARKPASIFVIEFDHNASVEELRSSHLSVYKGIRSIQEDVPLIFISRFSGGISISKEEEDERINIILNTLTYANKKNDNKIAFLCGKNKVKKEEISEYFVDDRHPNTKGMKLIAMEIEKIISKEGFYDKDCIEKSSI